MPGFHGYNRANFRGGINPHRGPPRPHRHQNDPQHGGDRDESSRQDRNARYGQSGRGAWRGDSYGYSHSYRGHRHYNGGGRPAPQHQERDRPGGANSHRGNAPTRAFRGRGSLQPSQNNNRGFFFNNHPLPRRVEHQNENPRHQNGINVVENRNPGNRVERPGDRNRFKRDARRRPAHPAAEDTETDIDSDEGVDLALHFLAFGTGAPANSAQPSPPSNEVPVPVMNQDLGTGSGAPANYANSAQPTTGQPADIPLVDALVEKEEPVAKAPVSNVGELAMENLIKDLAKNVHIGDEPVEPPKSVTNPLPILEAEEAEDCLQVEPDSPFEANAPAFDIDTLEMEKLSDDFAKSFRIETEPVKPVKLDIIPSSTLDTEEDCLQVEPDSPLKATSSALNVDTLEMANLSDIMTKTMCIRNEPVEPAESTRKSTASMLSGNDGQTLTTAKPSLTQKRSVPCGGRPLKQPKSALPVKKENFPQTVPALSFATHTAPQASISYAPSFEISRILPTPVVQKKSEPVAQSFLQFRNPNVPKRTVDSAPAGKRNKSSMQIDQDVSEAMDVETEPAPVETSMFHFPPLTTRKSRIDMAPLRSYGFSRRVQEQPMDTTSSMNGPVINFATLHNQNTFGGQQSFSNPTTYQVANGQPAEEMDTSTSSLPTFNFGALRNINAMQVDTGRSSAFGTFSTMKNESSPMDNESNMSPAIVRNSSPPNKRQCSPPRWRILSPSELLMHKLNSSIGKKVIPPELRLPAFMVSNVGDGNPPFAAAPSIFGANAVPITLNKSPSYVRDRSPPIRTDRSPSVVSNRTPRSWKSSASSLVPIGSPSLWRSRSTSLESWRSRRSRSNSPRNVSPRNTRNGSPGNWYPKNGTSRNCSPRNGSPRNGSPRNGSPRNGSPGSWYPKNGTSRNCSPQNCSPQNCSPRNGSPRNGSPRNGSPGSWYPKNGTSRNCSPQNGSPRNGSPRNGSSRNGSPGSWYPKNGTSRNCSPQNCSPRNGSPRNGSPRNGSPGSWYPKNGTSRNCSPQNGSPRNGSPRHRSPSIVRNGSPPNRRNCSPPKWRILSPSEVLMYKMNRSIGRKEISPELRLPAFMVSNVGDGNPPFAAAPSIFGANAVPITLNKSPSYVRDRSPPIRTDRSPSVVSNRSPRSWKSSASSLVPIGSPSIWRSRSTSLESWRSRRSRSSSPRNVSPRNARNGSPGNWYPKNGTSRNCSPRNGSPRNGSPRNGSPRNGSPRNGSPGSWYPRNGTSRNCSPQNGSPLNGSPRHRSPSIVRNSSPPNKRQCSPQNWRILSPSEVSKRRRSPSIGRNGSPGMISPKLLLPAFRPMVSNFDNGNSPFAAAPSIFGSNPTLAVFGTNDSIERNSSSAFAAAPSVFGTNPLNRIFGTSSDNEKNTNFPTNSAPSIFGAKPQFSFNSARTVPTTWMSSANNNAACAQKNMFGSFITNTMTTPNTDIEMMNETMDSSANMNFADLQANVQVDADYPIDVDALEIIRNDPNAIDVMNIMYDEGADQIDISILMGESTEEESQPEKDEVDGPASIAVPSVEEPSPPSPIITISSNIAEKPIEPVQAPTIELAEDTLPPVKAVEIDNNISPIKIKTVTASILSECEDGTTGSTVKILPPVEDKPSEKLSNETAPLPTTAAPVEKTTTVADPEIKETTNTSDITVKTPTAQIEDALPEQKLVTVEPATDIKASIVFTAPSSHQLKSAVQPEEKPVRPKHPRIRFPGKTPCKETVKAEIDTKKVTSASAPSSKLEKTSDASSTTKTVLLDVDTSKPPPQIIPVVADSKTDEAPIPEKKLASVDPAPIVSDKKSTDKTTNAFSAASSRQLRGSKQPEAEPVKVKAKHPRIKFPGNSPLCDRTNAKVDVMKEIKLEIKEEVEEEIKEEAKLEVKLEIKEEIEEEIKQEANLEIKFEIKEEVKGEVEEDIEEDIVSTPTPTPAQVPDDKTSKASDKVDTVVLAEVKIEEPAPQPTVSKVLKKTGARLDYTAVVLGEDTKPTERFAAGNIDVPDREVRPKHPRILFPGNSPVCDRTNVKVDVQKEIEEEVEENIEEDIVNTVTPTLTPTPVSDDETSYISDKADTVDLAAVEAEEPAPQPTVSKILKKTRARLDYTAVVLGEDTKPTERFVAGNSDVPDREVRPKHPRIPFPGNSPVCDRTNVKVDVKKEIKLEIKEEIEKEIKDEVNFEVKLEIKEEVKEEIEGEAKLEVKLGIKKEVEEEVEEDIVSTITPTSTPAPVPDDKTSNASDEVDTVVLAEVKIEEPAPQPTISRVLKKTRARLDYTAVVLGEDTTPTKPLDAGNSDDMDREVRAKHPRIAFPTPVRKTTDEEPALKVKFGEKVVDQEKTTVKPKAVKFAKLESEKVPAPVQTASDSWRPIKTVPPPTSNLAALKTDAYSSESDDCASKRIRSAFSKKSLLNNIGSEVEEKAPAKEVIAPIVKLKEKAPAKEVIAPIVKFEEKAPVKEVTAKKVKFGEKAILPPLPAQLVPAINIASLNEATSPVSVPVLAKKTQVRPPTFNFAGLTGQTTQAPSDNLPAKAPTFNFAGLNAEKPSAPVPPTAAVLVTPALNFTASENEEPSPPATESPSPPVEHVSDINNDGEFEAQWFKMTKSIFKTHKKNVSPQSQLVHRYKNPVDSKWNVRLHTSSKRHTVYEFFVTDPETLAQPPKPKSRMVTSVTQQFAPLEQPAGPVYVYSLSPEYVKRRRLYHPSHVVQIVEPIMDELETRAAWRIMTDKSYRKKLEPKTSLMYRYTGTNSCKWNVRLQALGRRHTVYEHFVTDPMVFALPPQPKPPVIEDLETLAAWRSMTDKSYRKKLASKTSLMHRYANTNGFKWNVRLQALGRRHTVYEHFVIDPMVFTLPPQPKHVIQEPLPLTIEMECEPMMVDEYVPPVSDQQQFDDWFMDWADCTMDWDDSTMDWADYTMM